MNSTESQRGNSDVFEQIKNRQVEAPMDIMNHSIQQAGKVMLRRKMFKWGGLSSGLAIVVAIVCLLWKQDAPVDVKIVTPDEPKNETTNAVDSRGEAVPMNQVDDSPSQTQIKIVEGPGIQPSELYDEVISVGVTPPENVVETISVSKESSPMVPTVDELNQEKVEKESQSEVTKKSDHKGQKKLRLKIPK